MIDSTWPTFHRSCTGAGKGWVITSATRGERREQVLGCQHFSSFNSFQIEMQLPVGAKKFGSDEIFAISILGIIIEFLPLWPDSFECIPTSVTFKFNFSRSSLCSLWNHWLQNSQAVSVTTDEFLFWEVYCISLLAKELLTERIDMSLCFIYQRL